MNYGIALSGGGVKGAAHIGVLKALEEKNIKISYVAGTSSGSIVATLYSAGYTPDEIYLIFKNNCKKIKYINFPNIFKLIKETITLKTIKIDGLNNGKNINKLINKICNKKNIYNISEIKKPLIIPSVDLNTGEVICFTSKNIRSFSDKTLITNNCDIGTAVEASCSFPGVFSPCRYKNRLLIDGGVRENTPWREAKLLGADKVISVVFETEINNTCCDNLFDVVVRSLELKNRELEKYEINGSDFIIPIKSKKTSLLDMSKIDEFYNLGYFSTKKFLEKNKL